ncbi:MAG: hypothetical protein FJX75_07950 [Armatimonadetes bacterium]|nr:hypothetical protein [Armatimonadota bacterium]
MILADEVAILAVGGANWGERFTLGWSGEVTATSYAIRAALLADLAALSGPSGRRATRGRRTARPGRPVG